jgi:hypothetical protein
MSFTKLSLAGNNLSIPAQGEFGQGHPGWGRENRKPYFYSVWAIFVANPTRSVKLIKISHAHFLLFSAVIMNYGFYRAVNTYLAYEGWEESVSYKEMSSILADQ